MARSIHRLAALLSVVALVLAACGGADAPEQVEVEQKVADAFNASHPNIRLTFEAVPYAGARDALATMIGSGNGPDIVGPAGIGSAEASTASGSTCSRSSTRLATT